MNAIIFCGLQATGKSSFYKKMFFNSHLRISLDLINTRNREKLLLEFCLKTQMPFVIDNTNPIVSDREYYIDLAKQNKYKIIGYYFQSKLSEAIQRNSEREGKQKLPYIAIKGTFNKLEMPSLTEGYDELYYVEIKNNEFIISEWRNEI